MVCQKCTIQQKNVEMCMFGERLKQERQRFGMNQDDFAAVGGAKNVPKFRMKKMSSFRMPSTCARS